jgi:hypothetical protein
MGARFARISRIANGVLLTRDGKQACWWCGDSVGADAAHAQRHDPDVIEIDPFHHDVNVSSGECVNQAHRDACQRFRHRAIGVVVAVGGCLSAGRLLLLLGKLLTCMLADAGVTQ